jgi:hypothetical protein
MTTALLDKIASAINHGRPKDAGKLLDQLRADITAGPENPPKAPRPGPTVVISMALDMGLTLTCAIPPRPGNAYTLMVSPQFASNAIALDVALGRGQKAFEGLCERFKEWAPERT